MTMPELDRSHLGPILGATIVCPDVDAAVAIYTDALGWHAVEHGSVDPARAAAWDAADIAGARYALLSPPEGSDTCYLRFVEDAQAQPPTPYTTAGWTALEFTVRSSVAAVDRIARGPFTVVGPAEPLEFSKGALWAGQVAGPYGEILYLTQINDQIDNFTLPQAKVDIDRIFIAITIGASVASQTDYFHGRLGTTIKDSFDAAIPFVADYQQLPRETEYHVGCVAVAPGHYLELDEMPTEVARNIPSGTLGGGIAMVSVACPSLARFAAEAVGGTAAADHGLLYAGAPSLVLRGPAGERIELIDRHVG